MKTYKTNIVQYKLREIKTSLSRAKINTSENAYRYLVELFDKEDIAIYECFYALYLNRSNNTISYSVISTGGTTSTVVDVKLIAKYAVESLATAVILCHNHPSGNIQPSTADVSITNKIKDALKLVDCMVLDHIIISPEERYFSFRDEGLI